MKKAKILIPAVAVLALSSAAAVTGTVAWFTASLKGTVESSGVTLLDTTSGSLTLALTEDRFGTTGAGTNEDPIVHAKLTDGSVDLVENDPYKAIVYNNIDKPTDANLYKVCVDGASGVKDRYCATKFTIKFSYKFSSDATTEAALFFDPTGFFQTASDDNSTNKGLRVGFVTETAAGADYVKVGAPFRQGESSLKYVDSTTKANGNYTGNTIITNAAVPTTYPVTTTTAPNCLGIFSRAGQSQEPETVDLTVSVYTWFEGEDPNVVTGKTLFTNDSLNLAFEAIAKPVVG